MTSDKNEHRESEYAFVKERIIVERPQKKASFIKRFFTTLILGLVFGITVAVVFVVALPYVQEFFHKPEIPTESSGDRVSIPLDEETGNTTEPEDNNNQTTEPTSEGSSTTAPTDETTSSDGEGETTTQETEPGLTKEEVDLLIEKALREKEYDTDDYKAFYGVLSGVVSEVNKSIVTITTKRTELDILEHSYDITDTLAGVVYSINEKNIYIMTDYSRVKDAEAINIVFGSGAEYEVEIQQADASSNIAVICMEKSELDDESLSKIKAITLGNSYAVKAGDPIIAVGTPMGDMYTMSYGIVTTTTHNMLKKTDAHYRVLNTNVLKSSSGNGFLVNLDGALVGILFSESEEDTEEKVEFCNAIAISDLKKRLEKMSNSESIPYFGIIGEDMIDESESLSLPGIYILQTEIGSPAYNAGIQNGDIIVSMANMEEVSMKSLRSYLESVEPGETVNIMVMRKGKDDYVPLILEVILDTN